MVLDFEYGVNTGNRFLQFVDHDEEPEAFIAAQAKEEEKQRKTSTKDSSQSTKKVTSKTTTTTTTKTNKENLTAKSTHADSRRQQSATTPAVFGDNNNQPRGDSARGARGGSRRGGPYTEGSGRGRSQRFNKFEGQGSSSTNETGSFEQGGDSWSNEAGSRGGRGRGGPRRGNFEGGRGTGGRGRGRGGPGRGNFSNRNQDDDSQQEGSGWQQSSETNFDSGRTRDYDQDALATDRSFEPDNTRRNNRGSHRGRGSHGNRNYSDREGEGGQEDYRANRRQFDRQPRSFVSGVKPIEKRDGEGAYNWGNPTENPEEHPISDEITETTAQAAPASKDWAQQVDEAEKQMTLDEYKKQMEAKKRANQEKLPQFKTRAAGEGEDPKALTKLGHEYRKKNDDEDEEEEEEGSEVEENESGEEEEEHTTGKKKLISIPLRFKPIEIPRNSGAQRRGGNRFRSNRDEQPRSTSPSQGQQSSSSQQYDDSHRGGSRGGRGDYRRPNRGSRQGRGNADPNAPSLDNPEDFPTLPKQ